MTPARQQPTTGLAAFLALGALAIGSCGGGEVADTRPDVLLLVIDTLRADRLGCYGYGRPTSPRIDALAESGTLFRDVTAQSGWTRPSMVSMLTGRYVTSHRIDVRDEEVTLAEAFHAAGYATLGVVANQTLSRTGGFHAGFDQYVVFNADRAKPGDVKSDRLTERLWTELDAFEVEHPNQPFFLYVHAFFPHAPYFRHGPFDRELPVLESPPPGPDGWSTFGELATADPDELEHVTRMRGRYDHEVRYTDGMVGRLVDGLAERGRVVGVAALASDHGEGLWDHLANGPAEKLANAPLRERLYQEHGAHLYSEAIGVPLLLWGTQVPRGLVVEAPIENVDLFPTMAELAGVAVASELHGSSHAPHLRGGPAITTRWTYSYLDHIAIERRIESNLKLILPGDGAHGAFHEVQLYDLHADPHERRNIAAERPKEVEWMTRGLRAWMDQHGAEPDDELEDEERALLEGLGYTDVELGD